MMESVLRALSRSSGMRRAPKSLTRRLGNQNITVYAKTMNELTMDKNCMPIMFHEVMYIGMGMNRLTRQNEPARA